MISRKLNNTLAAAVLLLSFTGVVASNAWLSHRLPDDNDVKPVIVRDTTTVNTKDSVVNDTVTPRWLPGEVKDTMQLLEQWRARQLNNFHAKINLLTRTYGDSVVLRWAPDDYVSWKYLCRVGVNVIRTDVENNVTDTLVMELKPASLEEFHSLYSDEDSLAGMAMGALYNQDALRPDQTEAPEGSVQSLYEIYQDQQMQFGVGVLVSELRPDLADKLAMRFVDRNVKKNAVYDYAVIPSVYDETGHVVIDAARTGELKNERYQPEHFNVEMGDSVTAPHGVRLWWQRRDYSSYEVERREQGSSDWQRLNLHPYIIMVPEQEDMDCFYNDVVEKPGTYEYRVFAHDPFGDMTDPSPVHTVTVRDMVPPRPPMITYIEIQRPDEDNPAAEIWAEIHVVKDTLEKDFEGMVPMYFHDRITDGEWKPLFDRDHLMAPTDTVCRVNVTNIPSCQVTVAAYDTAHNVSYSIPQLLRVSDMKAPDAPAGLMATPRMEEGPDGIPVGLIDVTWHPVADDDVDYYEVIFANDSTHEFMTQKHGIVRDTLFTDTVALDVNQKYIYYKVRAVDYSTNMGDYSDLLQVIRPSLIPPSVAHLDSAWIDGNGINIDWIAGNDEQMAYHKVYRRLENSDRWQLVAVCDADSVKMQNDHLRICDRPRHSSNRYEYFVESFNFSDVSSGPSLIYSVNYAGDPYVNIPIKLEAAYDVESGETRYAWEVNENDIIPEVGEGFDWYFCIWRQGPHDEMPKFLFSADKNSRSSDDRLLRPGETAKYSIVIQLDNGRESYPSNTVTVTAPEKK